MSSHPLHMQIKFHFETFFNFGCVILGVLGLVFYCRWHSRAGLFGTLPFYILTTILYGIAVGDNYFRQVLASHGVGFKIPIAYSWKVFFLIFPPFFTYVSGAVLALDRVLAMSFPLKHGIHSVSVKLTFFGLFVCLSTALLVCVCNAIIPASLELYATWITDSITYKLYQGTHKFYEFVFLAEVILHIVFCFQFHRYIQRQCNSVLRLQTQRANQITFFQIVTQSLLCLLPKIFHYANMLFFDSQVGWIQSYHSFNSFFLSINVFIVNCFIVYRFRPKRRTVTVVVSYNTNSPRNVTAASSK